MAAILQFDRNALLGNGGHSNVFRGTFNGRKVAVKRIDLLKTNGDNEETLQKLDHENVVKLLHVESNKDFKYFALELCAGSLDQIFLPGDDERKYNGPRLPPHYKVLYQLASGLAYIHTKKLILGDIKPENVLISVDSAGKEEVTMKWADFGLSRSVNERGSYTVSRIKGTEKWLAPELLNLINQGQLNEEIRGTAKSDVFAEGLVFGYFLLDGKHPFGTDPEITSNIIEQKQINMNGIHQSHYAKDLIIKMLMHNPNDRIKSEDVAETLQSIINHLQGEEKKFLRLCGRNQENLIEIKSLIQHGIDINAKNNFGENALHFLCCNYSNENLPDVVKLCIQHGIDISAKTKRGETALHNLCWNYSNENLPEIVKLFIQSGIDIHAKDKDGRTFLHQLCWNYSNENLPEIVKLFIQHGIDINAKDKDKRTVLHQLCRKYSNENLTEIVQLFIQHGIDINAKDKDGRTAFHQLCFNYSKENLPEIVKVFIQHGIDVECKDKDGNNALHYLASHYRLPNLIDIVKLALEKL